MGASYSNTNSLQASSATSKEIKEIPSESFAFRDLKFEDGKLFYELYTYCQVCGICRFTSEEVVELSSKDLTREIFCNKYPHLKYTSKWFCSKRDCELEFYQKNGGFDTHML